MKKYIWLTIPIFLIYNTAFAAFTIAPLTATSSNNIKITATWGQNGSLYNSTDTAPANFYLTGNCGAPHTFNCEYNASPSVGNNPQQVFATGGTLTLADGSYRWFEINAGGANPCNLLTGAACAAIATTEQDFQICSNGSCMGGGGGGSSSTPATSTELMYAQIDTLYYIQLLIDLIIISFFAWLIAWILTRKNWITQLWEK